MGYWVLKRVVFVKYLLQRGCSLCVGSQSNKMFLKFKWVMLYSWKWNDALIAVPPKAPALEIIAVTWNNVTLGWTPAASTTTLLGYVLTYRQYPSVWQFQTITTFCTHYTTKRTSTLITMQDAENTNSKRKVSFSISNF